MFAAIQNNRVIYFAEHRPLCEALARGFHSVDELRAWEADQPTDAWGVPLKPDAPFEIVELDENLNDDLKRLEAEGYRAGEILIEDVVVPIGDADEEPGAVRLALQSGAANALRRTRLVGDAAARLPRQSATLWQEVRARRDRLLSESDHYMLADFPIDEGRRRMWAEYRAKLRALTQDFDDPALVRWPTQPK